MGMGAIYNFKGKTDFTCQIHLRSGVTVTVENAREMFIGDTWYGRNWMESDAALVLYAARRKGQTSRTRLPIAAFYMVDIVGYSVTWNVDA